MKKALLIALLILLITGGIFYKQILATVDFYQYHQENPGIFAKATINWKQTPYTSTKNSGVLGESLTFKGLQMPIPFAATKHGGPDAAFAVDGSKSISVLESNSVSDFFTVNGFSSSEQKNVCHFLSTTSGLGACTSNYNFYRAFLELNETDLHVFANISDKTLYNRLLTIRAEFIPGKTISGFETNLFKGFLFTIDQGNYIGHLFDDQDQLYEIKFTNLEQGDVAFVLSNLSVIR